MKVLLLKNSIFVALQSLSLDSSSSNENLMKSREHCHLSWLFISIYWKKFKTYVDERFYDWKNSELAQLCISHVTWWLRVKLGLTANVATLKNEVFFARIAQKKISIQMLQVYFFMFKRVFECFECFSYIFLASKWMKNLKLREFKNERKR